ncbi:MAG: hypothetical protein CMA56_05175 [Euryarchaeota archaeon]|nr:hypothetical protein [Euryarchaeota archaeon]
MDVTVTAIGFHSKVGEWLCNVDVVLDGVAKFTASLTLKLLVGDWYAVLELNHVFKGRWGFCYVPVHPEAEFVQVGFCIERKPVDA